MLKQQPLNFQVGPHQSKFIKCEFQQV